jgi:hypothetical protein
MGPNSPFLGVDLPEGFQTLISLNLQQLVQLI